MLHQTGPPPLSTTGMLETPNFTGVSLSAAPSLEKGVAEVWLVELDNDIESIDRSFELLSEDEKGRANRFVFSKDRTRFIACRGALRRIVGRYLETAPEAIGFSARKFGKPYLTENDRGLRFNVSHSRDIALIALTLNSEVGIDVEYIDRDMDHLGIAPDIFSEHQMANFTSHSRDTRASMFFRRWTRKEAFLKAMGDGLSSSEEIQGRFSAIDDEDASISWFEKSERKSWSIRSFCIRDEFQATLVLEGMENRVRFWKQG